MSIIIGLLIGAAIGYDISWRQAQSDRKSYAKYRALTDQMVEAAKQQGELIEANQGIIRKKDLIYSQVLAIAHHALDQLEALNPQKTQLRDLVAPYEQNPARWN